MTIYAGGAYLENNLVKTIAMNILTTLFSGIVLFLVSYPESLSAQEFIELQPYSRERVFTGFTRPLQEMVLTGEVSGKCVDIFVDVGDKVESADVVEIDSTFIRLDLEQNVISQKKTQEQLDLEEKTLKRFTSLIQKNSTAQANYDEALFSANNLKLTLEGLKAEETRLKELLERHILKAPLGWMVLERFIEPGEYIRLGEPVLKLGDFNQLTVPFLLSFEELELLEKMEKIKLHFPELNRAVVAEIYRISPGFNEEKKKISVELITSGESQAGPIEWRGGLRTQLKIDGKKEQHTYLVPFTALISRYDANWLVSAEGTRKKVVLLGRSETGDKAIVAGDELYAGEKVYASPPPQ